MLCEKCKKNEATGYYEGTNKGVKTVMHLCTKCLLEKQKEMFGDFDMFSGFVGGGAEKTQKQRCSKCGTDLRTIAKTLFVGCPQCYAELSAHLNPIIKNIQGSTTHAAAAPAPDRNKSEIEKLKAQLSLAIAEERYEDAAILSGKLKALAGGQNGQSGQHVQGPCAAEEGDR